MSEFNQQGITITDLLNKFQWNTLKITLQLSFQDILSYDLTQSEKLQHVYDSAHSNLMRFLIHIPCLHIFVNSEKGYSIILVRSLVFQVGYKKFDCIKLFTPKLSKIKRYNNCFDIT